LNYVRKLANPDGVLLREALIFSRWSEVDDSVRQELSSWLEANHRDAVASFLEQSRIREQQRVQWAAENYARRLAERAERRFISQVVRELVDGSRKDRSHFIHMIGLAVFEREGPRPVDVVGTREDIDAELYGTMMRELVAALLEAEPSPVPLSAVNSYPTRLALEANAFAGALLTSDGEWLNAALVSKWLPCVLFVPNRKRGAVVAACHRVAAPECRHALLEALRRQVIGEDYANDVDSYPDDALRDESFLNSVIEIATSVEARTGGVRDIVFGLASRIGDRLVVPLLRARWPEASQLLVRASISYLKHGEGIGVVLAQIDERDDLSFLVHLTRYQWSWRVRWEQWASSLLAELAEWLVRRYPVASDPVRWGNIAHALSLDDKLRDLRDEVVNELLNRVDQAASDAHDRLAVIDKNIDERVKRMQSALKIDSILGEFDAQPERIRPKDVAEMLERGAPNRLRGADDLHFVLAELLDTVVGRSIEQGTNLVWAEATQDVKERSESKLVTLLQMMLAAELRLRWGERQEPILEPTLRYRDRPDLLFVGFGEGTESEATGIVIEVKWSHDSRLFSDLTKLARTYLRDQGLGHGLYFVGFSGHGSQNDFDALKNKLQAAAQKLEKANPSLRLHVAVVRVVRPAKSKRASKPGAKGDRKSAKRVASSRSTTKLNRSSPPVRASKRKARKKRSR
jgi:hypothetical protein